MTAPRSLISPDGNWWWDGRQWVSMHGAAPDTQHDTADAPVAHAVIAINRSVPLRYSREAEPPEIRARFGSVLLLIGFVLTLPAQGVGTVFSMAVATGQSPLWPTIGEGIVLYLIVLGFLGTWPLLGFVLGFGLRDGARWVLLCLAVSGAVPALFLGVLDVLADPSAGSDLPTMQIALGWMWAVPAAGLLLLRATHTGRPLPRAATFLSMLGSGWRLKLPGPQTQWGEVVAGAIRYPLRVPGADFALPPDAADAIYGAGGRARVTYDLQRGRIETIEVGA